MYFLKSLEYKFTLKLIAKSLKVFGNQFVCFLYALFGEVFLVVNLELKEVHIQGEQKHQRNVF